MNHDSCRKTKNGKYSGQNLYWSASTGGKKIDFTAQIKAAVASWWSEIKDATRADIKKFGSATDFSVIGHFTQAAWAVNTQVGCAISTYSDGKWTDVLIACNYGPGNMKGGSVYASGTAASKCKSVDSTFNSLCKA